ncbi:MAG: Tic22 family protein [Cyanobacteria bacterium P01_H01_bin.130]
MSFRSFAHSFARQWLAVGAVGITLTGSWLGGAPEAIAQSQADVTQEEITPEEAARIRRTAEILNSVPVFVVTTEEGVPLVREREDQAIAGAFINRGDAESFLQALNQENPELGEQLQVTLTPLGTLYVTDLQNNASETGFDVAYIPAEDQVELALAMPNSEEFRGVPLFYLANVQGNLVTIQREGKQEIPYFFEKDVAEALVARLAESDPALAADVELRVTSLEQMVAILQQPDGAQLGNLILLVPPQASVEELRQELEQQP